ncbi:hypothetical protein BDW_01535 [Bdellovibrio bacteriovorus W]|nr:hypothetical protein BDW_01535 [Bdellovibrio bacteriovorus W]
MKAAKIITVAILTITASASFANSSNSTKCDHRGSAGLFANTNPSVSTIKAAKVASSTTTTNATTKTGTR